MTKSNTSKSIPLAEITLRKYEKPYEMPLRDLVKKICLSVGLLQPGDSRDVIVDVLGVLLKEGEVAAENVKGKVVDFRQKHKLGMKGIAESNIRRQLKRLKDLFLVEKNGNNYRISEGEKLVKLFEEKIEQFYLKGIVDRVKEYFDHLDNFKK
ncbi:MAG: hypothetical protein CMH63_00590 [Nanoarchaeota archaeon]|jgi:hypothetical protein|nr:hypothetical protein [Nanoarchaeota archaeon]|tara:strand:- start:1139 stop:1597 length:459 start_codon:yes stop_codon:yes gene_type:complete